MFKGYRHTATCTKCNETTVSFDKIEDLNEYVEKNVSDCCNVKFEYIGLQPYNENILAIPLSQNNKQNTSYVIERTLTENDDIVEKVLEIKVEASSNPVTPKSTSSPKPSNGKMNNGILIPMMKDAIDNNNADELRSLRDTYPDIFEKSQKYLTKGYIQRMNSML